MAGGLGFLDPLVDKLGGHAENIGSVLGRIESHLSDIVLNTRAAVDYDEFTTRSDRATVDSEGTATIELSANEGFSWSVFRVGLTSPNKEGEGGNVAIYIGSVAPDNLVGAIREPITYGEEQQFFVPRGVSLIFHFYEQEAGVCTANVQVRQIMPKVDREARTGVGTEAFDHPRVEPVPSGSPLDTISAPPGG